MDINISLLIEMLVFAMLVWLTMKYIWPPILKAIEDRQKKIASGLAAGERGEQNLELARKKIKELLKKAKNDSANILNLTNKQAAEILEMAKKDAEEENKKIVSLAKEEIVAETEKAKNALRKQIVDLIDEAMRKIFSRNIDAQTDKKLVDEVIKEI